MNYYDYCDQENRSYNMDRYGNLIKRTKAEYPYSYDPFVVWQDRSGAMEKVCEDATGSVYTDRLLQWDWDKHNDLCLKHFGDKGQYWDNRDPKKIEAFLRDWTNDPKLHLIQVREYCNVSNGYPTWLLVYKGEKMNTKNVFGSKNIYN